MLLSAHINHVYDYVHRRIHVISFLESVTRSFKYGGRVEKFYGGDDKCIPGWYGETRAV